MIGAFARMFGPRDRVLSVEETQEGLQVTARTRGTQPVDHVASASDAPPEQFVQRIEHDGGDVYVVPLLEALREWLRKGRNVSRMSENREYDQGQKREG